MRQLGTSEAQKQKTIDGLIPVLPLKLIDRSTFTCRHGVPLFRFAIVKMITNRRKFHRIPVEEMCIAKIDGVDLECTLIDQSITGAKIAGLDFLVIPYGKALSIHHDDEGFDAVIRGVTRNEKNEMLIGIERSETADPDTLDKDAMLLNCYIRHEGNLMVCIPISVEADGRVRVQLWDGMQFPINFTALVTMNRTERYKSLMKGSNLSMIADLYGITDVPMNRLLDTLFEFEFGHLSNCNAKASFSSI